MGGQEEKIIELQNTLEFCKQALLFYSTEDNYKSEAIKLDNGHQARFALEQMDKVRVYNSQLNDISKLKKQMDSIDDEGVDFGDMSSKLDEINKIITKYATENGDNK